MLRGKKKKAKRKQRVVSDFPNLSWCQGQALGLVLQALGCSNPSDPNGFGVGCTLGEQLSSAAENTAQGLCALKCGLFFGFFLTSPLSHPSAEPLSC